MQVGLLWFDDSPSRGLVSKVEDAARRYREKYGAVPNTCFVNQAALAGDELVLQVPGAQPRALYVLPARNIPPHHFWVGVDDTRESRQAA